MWSAEGSYECQECPKGTIKKISGNFSLGELDVFNMDTIQNDHWYYIENEFGSEQTDCAKVPPAIVQIPQLNANMEETAQNQQFLPLITCPYGFSNRPGTYIIQDKWLLEKITTDIAFSIPPYVKNNGIESAIISPIPCDCIVEKNENGMNILHFTPPTVEQCWKYATIATHLSSLNGDEKEETVNALYIDDINTFWDGCAKFVDSTVVHYGYQANQGPKYVKNIPTDLQFICIKQVTNIELTKQIAAQYCFTCPGDSITGPDSGVCSTCPANMVKKNMKLAIQKLVERSYPRLYQCYSSDNGIENNIVTAAKSYVGSASTDPQDKLIRCKEMVKTRQDQSLDVEYKEENIQAWQFIIDENTIWKVDSVFWPIIESSDTKVNKLTLSDCVLACSTTWGNELKEDRNVRVGIALKESDRNFCLCNDGGSAEAYYRYVGTINPDVENHAKYKPNSPIQSQLEQILWYQSQVEESWNKIRPLCGSCTPGKILRGSKCESCGKGQYTSTAEEAMQTTCQNCPIGFYQSSLGKSYCSMCMVGLAINTVKAQNCKGCKAGYYGDERGKGLSTNYPTDGTYILCKECPTGFFQVETKKTSCDECVPGKYESEVAKTTCKECQMGKYTDQLRQTVCKLCSPGYHNSQNSQPSCKKCSSGKYEDTSGRESSDCKPCSVGKYQNEEAQAICEDCQPSGTTEKPDGLLREGNYFGFQDSQGQTSCKVCTGGHTCTGSATTSCPAGNVNKAQPDTEFTPTCTPCTGRDTANADATACVPCVAPKKLPSSSGIGCDTCPHGSHSFSVGKTGRPVCKPCLKSQYIIDKGCNPCAPGSVMHPNEDTKCKKCDGNNEIAKTGVCQQCNPYHVPNTARTKCCPGAKWNEMFTGFSSTASLNTGSTFLDSITNQHEKGCWDKGPGPQVICYASWKIQFTKDMMDLCFTNAEAVDDQVAIYTRPADFDGSGFFPNYFNTAGCGCNGGCACQTDYPHLMNYDDTWGTKNSLQWSVSGGIGQKCMSIDAKKDDKITLVMWYFNEDDSAGNQALKLASSVSDADAFSTIPVATCS